MKTPTRRIILLALLASLLLVSAALADPAALTLDRSVIGGGGAHLETEIYTLDGTLGQPLVGVERAAPFELCAGFWCGKGAQYIYLPLVLRSP